MLEHEFAAVLSEGPREGQRVAVDPAVPCLRCGFCLEGNPNFCEHLRFAGHSTQDGALREHMAWPTHGLFPVPDTLSDAERFEHSRIGVAIHAVDLGKVRTGM